MAGTRPMRSTKHALCALAVHTIVLACGLPSACSLIRLYMC